MSEIQCMHSGCYRRSNVFITNNDAAGLQTHDCCTRHDCARRLAEVEAERNKALNQARRLAEVEAERNKALNQARHWQEQEGKQRRLRHEEGRWKHRALQAELNASDLPGLRARLAEVEAAHSCAANLWAHEVAKVAEQRDRAEAAEARLAKVESERGIWQETARRFCQNADYWRERTEAAEARLAEVEALCEDAKRWGRTLSPFEVRAAARGEGDRG